MSQSQPVKLFMNGRSQALRLPLGFRFEQETVYLSRDPDTGNVIVSPHPTDWETLFAEIARANVPSDFLNAEDSSLNIGVADLLT